MLILAVLEGGPAHGYAIIEVLRQRSQGTFDLPEGTVYPALHRLEDQGLLCSAWTEDTGRRKRVYELTVKGREAVAARRQEWQLFSRAINSTIGI